VNAGTVVAIVYLDPQDYVVGCLGQLFDEVCRATVVISEN
jgi:hypothetical protein